LRGHRSLRLGADGGVTQLGLVAQSHLSAQSGRTVAASPPPSADSELTPASGGVQEGMDGGEQGGREHGPTWFLYRSLHCLPLLPLSCAATMAHLRSPCSLTSLTMRSSSSCVHGRRDSPTSSPILSKIFRLSLLQRKHRISLYLSPSLPPRSRPTPCSATLILRNAPPPRPRWSQCNRRPGLSRVFSPVYLLVMANSTEGQFRRVLWRDPKQAGSAGKNAAGGVVEAATDAAAGAQGPLDAPETGKAARAPGNVRPGARSLFRGNLQMHLSLPLASSLHSSTLEVPRTSLQGARRLTV